MRNYCVRPAVQCKRLGNRANRKCENASNRMAASLKTPSSDGAPPNTKTKGQLAEQMAADHLVDQGYSIIARNFNCKYGEIDIIAEHEGDLVFVEVRSGKKTARINPIFSINRTKCRKIIRTARLFLQHNPSTRVGMRFDVVIVSTGLKSEVLVVKNAFTLDDVW